jgi:hypothetical protein
MKIFVILFLLFLGCQFEIEKHSTEKLNVEKIVERPMKDKQFSNCSFAYIGGCKYVYCIDHFGDLSVLSSVSGACAAQNDRISTDFEFTKNKE